MSRTFPNSTKISFSRAQDDSFFISFFKVMGVGGGVASPITHPRYAYGAIEWRVNPIKTALYCDSVLYIVQPQRLSVCGKA